MIDGWLLGSAVVWLLLHVGFASWGRGHRLERFGQGTGAVRVCVPARDEALNIAACVGAVLADPRVTELVVVDDGSLDGTASLASAAAAGDARCEVRLATSRPAGWLGKPWACAEAASSATTDWLLFIDADVALAPGAVGAAIARAEFESADFASLFGSWELVTFWERLCIPAFGWLIRSVVDLGAVNAGSRAFANGQFLLVRRSAYERLGGHGVVRGEILDDVRFAERARGAGLAGRLWWAPWAFRVRLYRGLGEIVAGYRKNLHEGLGRSVLLTVAAALAVFTTTALPVLGSFALLAAGDLPRAAWAALVVLLCVTLRMRLEQRDGRSPAIAVLHPLAGAILAVTLVLSIAPGSWKGRALSG